MTAPLQHLSITVKVVPLEKVSFSDTQNPKAVCLQIEVNDKHYSLDRDNLTERIQIQLSQKIFSELFFTFLKPILNFKYLP